MKYFFPIILLLFISCSTMVHLVIPLDDLPLPTGPYKVGTKLYAWTDSSRQEWFDNDSNPFRRIPVQVWYPMGKGTHQLQSFYLDYPKDYIHVISTDFGIPGKLLVNVANIRTSAVFNGNPNQELRKRPVIIFSHGLGGFKNQNTVQFEELASHGYVIFSCDHVYDAGFVRFSDEEIIYSKSYVKHFPEGTTDEEYWTTREKQLLIRSQDISFVIDQIERIDTIDPSISPLCNSKNISLMGHSFGGATILQTSSMEENIKSCIVIDAWALPIPSMIINQDISTPLVHIGQMSDKYWKNKNNKLKLDTLFQNNGQKSIMVKIPKTKHFDYSDFSQFTWATKLFGISGNINREKLKNMINKLILHYLNNIQKDSEELDIDKLKGFSRDIIITTNLKQKKRG